jgi:corrinoid protein of di/trimethylamine methyltransferase
LEGGTVEQDEILVGLRQAVVSGDSELAERWAREAVRSKVDARLMIEGVLRKALDIVGDRFHRQEIFLPELVMAGEAAIVVSAILEKEMGKTGARTQSQGVVVIGTVSGDLHDIGKSLVATLFRASGFSVIDLGINVAAETFVNAVKEHKCDILGLSALLTTTMTQQKVTIDALKKAGIRSQVKVMVGGGVVTQAWANEIGADAYGEDAMDAVETAKRLLGLP